jgi:hypothetical protein
MDTTTGVYIYLGCASIGERRRNMMKSLQALGIVANMSNPYLNLSCRLSSKLARW